MVIDFGRVKEALMVVHDDWDHRFLLGADDPLAAAMADLPGVVVVDRQPTAENLAALAAERLAALLAPLNVTTVTVQETSSCEAEWNARVD